MVTHLVSFSFHKSVTKNKAEESESTVKGWVDAGDFCRLHMKWRVPAMRAGLFDKGGWVQIMVATVISLLNSLTIPDQLS